jgi:hypothetical protein
MKGVNMTGNECFRPSTSTFGVRLEDGKPASTVTIPRDSVVKIVSGVETRLKMIEVDWQGLRVLVFVQDVHERGELVDQPRAEASKT